MYNVCKHINLFNYSTVCIQRPVSTLTKQNAAWNVNIDAGVLTSVNIDPQRCAVVGIHYELQE